MGWVECVGMDGMGRMCWDGWDGGVCWDGWDG